MEADFMQLIGSTTGRALSAFPTILDLGRAVSVSAYVVVDKRGTLGRGHLPINLSKRKETAIARPLIVFPVVVI